MKSYFFAVPNVKVSINPFPWDLAKSLYLSIGMNPTSKRNQISRSCKCSVFDFTLYKVDQKCTWPMHSLSFNLTYSHTEITLAPGHWNHCHWAFKLYTIYYNCVLLLYYNLQDFMWYRIDKILTSMNSRRIILSSTMNLIIDMTYHRLHATIFCLIYAYDKIKLLIMYY